MKKTNLVLGIAGAIALAGVASAAAFVGIAEKPQAAEASSAYPHEIYPAFDENFTDRHYHPLFFTPGVWETSDARFAVYCFEKDDGGATIAEQWFNAVLNEDEGREKEGDPAVCVEGEPEQDCKDWSGNHLYYVLIPKSASVVICRMNGETSANNWDNKWNQTNDITELHDGLFRIDGWGGEGQNSPGHWDYYTLYINDEAYEEGVVNGDDLDQVGWKLPALHAGDKINVRYANDSDYGTLRPDLYYPYINNLKSDETLKADMEAGWVFMSRKDWSVIITGYFDDSWSDELMIFINGMLEDTISNGVCTDSKWAELTAMWADDLSDVDRATWNAANTPDPSSQSFSNVLEEAKARYFFLVNALGFTPIEGITGGQGRNFLRQNAEKIGSYVAIGALTLASLAAVTWFAISKKKQFKR